MERSNTIIFEYLTIIEVLVLILNKLFHNRKLLNDIKWIDASNLVKKIFELRGIKFRISIEKLDFQLVNVINEYGEFIRTQIPRKDLFSFRDLIYHNIAISSDNLKVAEGSRFQFFLRKQLFDGGIVDQDSVSRVLYLINVVARSDVLTGSKGRVLVLRDRPWKKEYVQYAESLGLELRWATRLSFSLDLRRVIKFFLLKFPRLYNFMRRFRGTHVNNQSQSEKGIIFIQGRGDARLVNDGNNSDFDWLLQSEFSRERVIYQCPDEASKNMLLESGIRTVLGLNSRTNNHTGYCQQPFARQHMMGLSSLEKYKLESLKQDYEWGKLNLSGFFWHNNIQVFMTWFKYDGIHAVMADAIQTLGGISAVNQVAFDGYRNFECQVSADVVFGFSEWSAQLEKEMKSEIPYFVIAGYPRDHAKPLLEVQARELRNRLLRAGSRKIIFSIDENSLDDDRWHTGHTFQQEHYRYVLEKVLELPWLGAVFKPKAPHTLRQRLGKVNDLLCAAEQTGRCVVLDGRHYVTTIESVLLAGLASDVCIHGHLSAGTAALECALAGIPTLLVNREQVSHSKLNELPKGKVVFDDWPATIDAVMEHFSSETGIPGFGEWGGILDELDPFRDGKASQRIGTYLQWLLEGFDQGWDREKVLAEAAERYKNCWGADKVIAIG